MTICESTVIEDIYDTIFKNDYKLMNFVQEFPNSWIDNDNARIYLANDDGQPLFIIKIERV